MLLYVGADLDTFPLRWLQHTETRIVYVDPLVAWRNSPLIFDANARTAAKVTDIDTLFECTDCAPRLRRSDLREVRRSIARGIERARESCENVSPEEQAITWNGGVVANDTTQPLVQVTKPIQALGRIGRNLTVASRSPAPHTESPAFVLTFEMRGVRRSLEYWTARAEDLNLTALLQGWTVSSFVTTGSNTSHSWPWWNQLCRLRPAHPVHYFGDMNTWGSEGGELVPDLEVATQIASCYQALRGAQSNAPRPARSWWQRLRQGFRRSRPRSEPHRPPSETLLTCGCHESMRGDLLRGQRPCYTVAFL